MRSASALLSMCSDIAKPWGFLIEIRRDIATHYHLIADPHAPVHDLVGPIGRDLIRQRRPAVTEKRAELAGETPLVEFERRFAFALETEIRVHLHGVTAGHRESPYFMLALSAGRGETPYCRCQRTHLRRVARTAGVSIQLRCQRAQCTLPVRRPSFGRSQRLSH